VLTKICDGLLRTLIVLFALSCGASAIAQSVSLDPGVDREELIFTPTGFDKPGQPAVAEGDDTGELRLVVRDTAAGETASCRVNVVGPDGNFYEPADKPLQQYSLTGEWPNWPNAWGNRPGKAPFRYFGRFFYMTGECSVRVPTGSVRIEVWKGFEYRPVSMKIEISAGDRLDVELELERAIDGPAQGYHSARTWRHRRIERPKRC